MQFLTQVMVWDVEKRKETRTNATMHQRAPDRDEIGRPLGANLSPLLTNSIQIYPMSHQLHALFEAHVSFLEANLALASSRSEKVAPKEPQGIPKVLQDAPMMGQDDFKDSKIASR